MSRLHGVGICWLRGGAPLLIWPARTMKPIITTCTNLRENPVDDGEVWKWNRDIMRARGSAAKAFAEAQGWLAAERKYPVSRLVRYTRSRRGVQDHSWAFSDDTFDHGVWFRAGRSVAGVVVHLYGNLALDAIPAGIVVDRLPRSWYCPQRTTAYIYRPAAAIVAGGHMNQLLAGPDQHE